MGKKKKGNKGVQIAVAAVAAVATVVTMGAAAPIVGAAILGEVGVSAAVAATEVLGSAATYASVTGGAVIGAAGGAISGAAGASLVGADLAEGALKGAVVGSVSGVAGLVGAGYASTALSSSGLAAELGEAGTAAVTGGVKGATANVVGAEMQGRDPLTAGIAGLVGGAATPLVGGILNEGNLPTTDTGKAIAATLGGGISGATRASLTGGDVLAGGIGGAAMGGVGAYLEPALTSGLANTLFGGASTTQVSEAVGEQLTREQHVERINYLTEVQKQYADRGDEEGAQRIANALSVARTQFEEDLPRLASAEQAAEFQQTTPRVDITGRQTSDATPTSRGGDSTASVTVSPGVTGGGTGATARPTDELTGLYQKYFGRDVDPEGRAYWTQSGLTGEDLARSVLGGAQKSDYDYYMAQLVGSDTSGAGSSTAQGGGTTTTEQVTQEQPSDTSETRDASTEDDRTRQILNLISSDGSEESDGSDGTYGFGGDPGAETEQTTPPTDPSQKKVITSPVYIDPAIRRRAAAAPASVRSAGLDPATSGVLLGKYGKKDQVWNEATLRLADALGIR